MSLRTKALRLCARRINGSPALKSGISAVARPQICSTTRNGCRGFATPAPEVPKLGQAVHETHPHLLEAGEITPGITALEYHQRRLNLADLMRPGEVAVLPASTILYRAKPVFYDFHQEPAFLYLTGWLEPDAVAVIEKTTDSNGYHFTLFVQPKHPKVELWEGPRTGIQNAMEFFNADEAHSIEDLNLRLPLLLENASKVYADSPVKVLEDSKRIRWYPLAPLVDRLRVRKSPAEVKVMRKAGQISGRAYADAMRHNFTREVDLWAHLAYKFITGGCEKEAYVPVVAGGGNGRIIHYTRNNELFKGDEMVLVDAGGQYGGYITDISRTWPISGKFTAAQRDLYSAVLTVQRQCVKLCTEAANVSLDSIHDFAASELNKELRKLGFDNSAGLFPHHVGHYIGLNVHDSATFGRKCRLEENMCVTMEPGVYVPDDDRYPKHFRNMAIRIEDSIAVGKDFPLVLTTEAPKEVEDIEALGAEHTS